MKKCDICYIILIAVFSIILIYLLIPFGKKTDSERDEYGCLVSEGYAYQELLKVCAKEEILNSDNIEVIINLMEEISPEHGLSINEILKGDCLGCFDVEFDILGKKQIKNICSWNLVSVFISEGDCLSREGRLLNYLEEKRCFVSEMPIGKFISSEYPGLCCVEKEYCKMRGNVCMTVYEPVCGFGVFGKETYSNSCFACKDLKVEYYIQGECL